VSVSASYDGDAKTENSTLPWIMTLRMNLPIGSSVYPPDSPRDAGFLRVFLPGFVHGVIPSPTGRYLNPTIKRWNGRIDQPSGARDDPMVNPSSYSSSDRKGGSGTNVIENP
jgi:hypothetical protein